MAFSWLYKEKVKGLSQLEKVMVYAMTYVIISVYLLCVGGLSLIISDQEDESIWKIDCQRLALKHRVLFHSCFGRPDE